MGPVERADVVIVGAGAAGLMAAIWAGRTFPEKKVVLLDGAAKLGAKILVAGGGRCNVTHYQVDPKRYAGSSTAAIAKVLKRFDVTETVAFFRELGVELKREETGKLFPTTDSAKDVLRALLGAVARAGVDLRHPMRVEWVERVDALAGGGEGRRPDGGRFAESGFEVGGAWGRIRCAQLVLATGGLSLPKSGSDGKGFEFARALGHSVSRTFPALVPLTVSSDDPLRELGGITVPATIRLHASSGKRITEFTNSTLCTHFGLSGPSVLDMSRHLLKAMERDPGAYLTLNWVPGMDDPGMDAALQGLGHGSVRRFLQNRDLPDRLATMLLRRSGLDVETRGDQMTRAERRSLVRNLTEMRLEITGTRGYKFAEVTAGGVPLREIDLKTMASRVHPGLFLCGEICDVDGPIGGLNFQWAWSSGYVVGCSLDSVVHSAPERSG